MVCQRGDDWVQVGIASFSSADDPGDYYAAFTRVSYYLDWIQDTISMESGGGGGTSFDLSNIQVNISAHSKFITNKTEKPYIPGPSDFTLNSS